MTALTITNANAHELQAGDVVSFRSTLGHGHYFDRVTLVQAGLELAVGATESPTGFDYAVTNPDGTLRRYVRDLVKHGDAETWEDVTDDVSVLKVGDEVRVTRRADASRDPGKVTETVLVPSLFGLPALSYRDSGDTWTVVAPDGSRHHALAKVERKVAASATPEPAETWEDVTDDVSALEVGDEVRVTRSNLVTGSGHVWHGALLDGADDPLGREGDLTIAHGDGGTHFFVRARGRLHRSLAKVERKATTTLTDAQKHAADIKAIGEHMLKAAERERMCGIFDREVEELNKSLNVKLPERPRKFHLERVVTVIAPAVEATSLEEAERAFEQMIQGAKPEGVRIVKIETDSRH